MWLYLDELQLIFKFRISFRSNDILCAELWFPWTCIFCSNFKLSGLFLTDVLWDIDLIFGMWLYLVELQFKFEFRSGRMIFGWVMTLELVFFVQILSCPGFFFDVLWDIDLIFGMWLYLVELQFKFEFRSGRMIFGWVMALELVFFVQILSCPGLFWRPLRYWLDIWYVAISMSYSWISNFVPVEWYLAELWPLNFFFKF